MKTETPIEQACAIVGGHANLAKILGVGRTRVYYWLKSGRTPAQYCFGIETATRGRVTRRDLAPHVFGPPVKKERAA